MRINSGILNLAKNVLLSNVSELSLPYRMTLALTYRCNLRCSICGIWRKPPQDELTPDELRRILCGFGNLSWLNLTGGEIFLRRDLPQIFSLIKECCPRLYLLNFATNGSEPALIRSTIGAALELGIPKLLVTVSLDGPRATHDSIRGVEGSWARAVETFGLLRELRGEAFDVFLGYTIQEANIGLFDETLSEAAAALGAISANDFHVNVAHHSGHFYANAPLEKELAGRLWAELEAISLLRDHGKLDPVAMLEHRYQGLGRRYLEAPAKSPLQCQALAASLFMSPSGRVYPCTIFDSPVGDIRRFDYDISALWATRPRGRMRAEIKAGRCPGCWTPCEAYQSILGSLPRALGAG